MADGKYVVQQLLEIKGLDIALGMSKSGNRDAYFRSLDQFISSGLEFVEQYTEHELLTRQQKLLIDITKINPLLQKIGAREIIQNLDLLVEFIKSQNSDLAKSCLFESREKITMLHKKISSAREVEKEPQKDNPQSGQSETKKYSDAIKEVNSGVEKADKIPGLLVIGMFDALIKNIDEFQLMQAAQRVEKLQKYHFTDDIDKLLNNIDYYLQNFDQSSAVIDARLLATIANEQGSLPMNKVSANKQKVLAIDDNTGVLNTLRSMLKTEYDVFCIPDREAVFRFLSMQKPDIILLDIEMPQMDGFEMLGLIRNYHALKNVPVLFLTGNATVDHFNKAKLVGVNDFIRKPVDRATLLQKIEYHIKNSQQ